VSAKKHPWEVLNVSKSKYYRDRRLAKKAARKRKPNFPTPTEAAAGIHAAAEALARPALDVTAQVDAALVAEWMAQMRMVNAARASGEIFVSHTFTERTTDALFRFIEDHS
jgi:hypothetical protein